MADPQLTAPIVFLMTLAATATWFWRVFRRLRFVRAIGTFDQQFLRAVDSMSVAFAELAVSADK